MKLVTSGAGAAALACVDLLVSMGVRARERDADRHQGRGLCRAATGHAAQHGPLRPRRPKRGRCRMCWPGADVFLGLSAPRVLKPEWLPLLADKPLILALANPDPEITPEAARAVRPDAIIATGRSDYPNQVNNVLCFPFIFRGALDVGATDDQRGDEDRRGRGDRGPGAGRGERGGGRGLWRRRAGVRPGLHHPQALRSAADPADRAGGGAGGDGQPASRAGRSRISTPISDELERFVYPLRPADAPGVRGGAEAAPSASSMPRARTSGCCARCRPCSMSGIAAADPDRPPRRDRGAGARDWACAWIWTRRSACSIPSRTATVFGPLVARLPAPGRTARRRRPTRRRGGSRTRTTVAAAMLLQAGQADAAICGGTGNWWRHMHYCCRSFRAAAGGRRGSMRSPALILPTRRAVLLRHPHDRRSDRRADRRDDPAGRRGGARLRHHAQGGAAVAFQLRRQRHADSARKMRAGAAADPRARRRSSRWMARCTPMRR